MVKTPPKKHPPAAPEAKESPAKKGEKTFLARTFLSHMQCPSESCDGYMQHNGHRSKTDPPMFTHVCNKCERVSQYATAYPTQSIVPLDGKPLDPKFEQALKDAEEAPQEASEKKALH